MVYKLKSLKPERMLPTPIFVGVDQPSAREKVRTTLGLADRRAGDPKVVYTFFKQANLSYEGHYTRREHEANRGSVVAANPHQYYCTYFP